MNPSQLQSTRRTILAFGLSLILLGLPLVTASAGPPKVAYGVGGLYLDPEWITSVEFNAWTDKAGLVYLTWTDPITAAEGSAVGSSATLTLTQSGLDSASLTGDVLLYESSGAVWGTISFDVTYTGYGQTSRTQTSQSTTTSRRALSAGTILIHGEPWATSGGIFHLMETRYRR